MTNFERVKAFMRAFDQATPDFPKFPSKKIQTLRKKLIKEEHKELTEAMKDNNLKEVADAIADILYVTYGCAVAFGLDADAIFKEVHDSNMTKLGADGKPVTRDDGKVVKGPNYRPPDLTRFIDIPAIS